MPRLDVVVAHGDRVVAEVVHRRGDDVRREGVDVVVVVRRGLALQEVTSIQQQGLGVGATDLTQYRREARHTPRAWAVIEEVVGEDIPVDVGRVEDAELVLRDTGGLLRPGYGA